MPTATGDIPSLVGSLAELTDDDIARRAYQFYEVRGGEHGLDQLVRETFLRKTPDGAYIALA